MRHSLIALALILGVFIVTTSCKITEGVEIETVENVAKVPDDNSLSAAMKKASTVMRRLSKAVGSNDWNKMDMWLQELKHSIGFSCVELYMIENNHIPDEYKVLSNKFNSAINKLILCGKNQDTEYTKLEFNNLVKSCKTCHESYNKDAEGLDFTDSGGNS